MDFMHLALHLPRLTGEQAYGLQQSLYAFLDEFNFFYSQDIELYLKNKSNQHSINNLKLQELLRSASSDSTP